MNGLMLFAMGVAILVAAIVAAEFLEELESGERFRLFQ
jgi:hypothetical protein